MHEHNIDIAAFEQLNRQELVNTINELILNDFEKLVFVMYRIDVNEAKIKSLLASKTDTNAAELIADAIIERLQQKKAAKEIYKQQHQAQSSEEKW
ncbi:MAG: hypothetical protein Q8K64_10440 [Sediminibacterium sp.]|nr:MAG: hypothetical protein FD183_696 [Chitinophagaceae bacterium]MDP1843828.1 hypothetical protein [Sediminibacterium sp.]TXT33768.1 MAG: hypothetical protein FD136_717 [Chitinophagaceae bacterium]